MQSVRLELLPQIFSADTEQACRFGAVAAIVAQDFFQEVLFDGGQLLTEIEIRFLLDCVLLELVAAGRPD